MMRRNRADAVGYLLLRLFLLLYFLPLLIRVDSFNREMTAFLMIANAVYFLIWMLLPPLVVLLTNRKSRSRRFRLLFAGFSLLLTANMVFHSFPTVIPQLYEAEKPNPVREIQKAIAIMNDNSEPVTETGYCRIMRFRQSNILPFVTRYALITENGALIPCSLKRAGLYTVTYSPETGLPTEIHSYDPECGENVIAWGALIPSGLGLRNNQSCVRVKKLERPFPLMYLRVMKDGAVYEEKRYREDDSGFFISIPSDASGIFEAQLFSVTIGSCGDRYEPISNKAVLNYRT